jgi:hypothetical protein
VNELLVARIEARHIHVLAQREIDLEDLPQASILQKTDIAHGAQSGMIVGGLLGILVGVALLLFPLFGSPIGFGVVLVAAILGAAFGAWAASLAGSSVPNSRLAGFREAVERGRKLLMADVPFARLGEISNLIATRHPEAISGGGEPTIPAFP